MAQTFSTRRNLEREWFPWWWRSNWKECASQKIKERCIAEVLPFTFLLGDHREETSGRELMVEKRESEGFCRWPTAPSPPLFRSRWYFLRGMSWLLEKKQQTLPKSLFQRTRSQSFLYGPLLDSNKRRNAAGGHQPRSCVPSGHLPLPDAFGLQMSGGGGDLIESQNSKVYG